MPPFVVGHQRRRTTPKQNTACVLRRWVHFLRKDGFCNGWDAEGDGEARTSSSSQKHHHALVLLDCNIEFIYYSPKTHLLHSRRGEQPEELQDLRQGGSRGESIEYQCQGLDSVE